MRVIAIEEHWMTDGIDDGPAITDFLGTLPDRGDQQKLAHANAELLYGLQRLPSGSDDHTAHIQEQP